MHYFQNFALNHLDEFILEGEFEFISHKCISYMVAFITIFSFTWLLLFSCNKIWCLTQNVLNPVIKLRRQGRILLCHSKH